MKFFMHFNLGILQMPQAGFKKRQPMHWLEKSCIKSMIESGMQVIFLFQDLGIPNIFIIGMKKDFLMKLTSYINMIVLASFYTSSIILEMAHIKKMKL